jgi:hypothetical protein
MCSVLSRSYAQHDLLMFFALVHHPGLNDMLLAGGAVRSGLTKSRRRIHK